MHRTPSSEVAAAQRIAITGGGTAGHIFMGLALAEAFTDAGGSAELLFLGTPDGLEKELVLEAGYRFAAVPAFPLYGVGGGGVLRAAAGLVTGVRRARALLQERGVDLVIGLGGYASGPTMLAAASLPEVAAVLLEPNATPGLTNRWLGKMTQLVFLGHEIEATAFASAERRIVGTPVRRDIVELGREERQAPNGGDRPACILVLGGSKGHDFFSLAGPELCEGIRRLGVEVEAIHHSGDADVNEIQTRYRRAGVRAEVQPFIRNMVDAYRRADWVLTRAGAVSLSELATCGLPALVVPWSKSAGDHQTANAETYCRRGGAVWTTEATWDAEDLARRLAESLRNPDSWLRLSKAARAWARPEAAGTIVAGCRALLNGAS